MLFSTLLGEMRQNNQTTRQHRVKMAIVVESGVRYGASSSPVLKGAALFLSLIVSYIYSLNIQCFV